MVVTHYVYETNAICIHQVELRKLAGMKGRCGVKTKSQGNRTDIERLMKQTHHAT